MILKLGIDHKELNAYKYFRNDDPGLTLTYFMARSKLVKMALGGERLQDHLFLWFVLHGK